MSFRYLGLSFGLLLVAAACSSSPAAGSGAGGLPDAGADAPTGDASPDTTTACTPEPETSEPVTLQNEFGTLGGVLEIPAGCGPRPVIVLISGSGSTDRDGNVPGDPDRTDVYKMLAAALRADAHVATLRYDDHGIGASTSGAPANVEDFRFDIEIADAARWITQLRADPRFSKVILAGHSQGSLTAILAAKTAPIDAWISLAGAGRPAGRLIHDQLAPKLTPELLAELDAAIAKLEQGELAGKLSSPLDQVLPMVVQPYLISWMKYDPKTEVAALEVPGVVVQGLTDRQVSTLDAELLVEGKPDAKLVLVENMSHPLKQASADSAEQHAAYSDPSVPLATGLMPALVEFLAANTR